MKESSSNGWKTLWDKEKLLVTSIFSFSHSVFTRLVLQTHKNQGLFGKDADCIENIDEIGEIAHFEQFLIFPQCFPKALFFIVLNWLHMEEKVKVCRVIFSKGKILEASKLRAIANCTDMT